MAPLHRFPGQFTANRELLRRRITPKRCIHPKHPRRARADRLVFLTRVGVRSPRIEATFFLLRSVRSISMHAKTDIDGRPNGDSGDPSRHAVAR